ncbi:zf-HC2 domain-containing protein [Micrococcus sp.]|uniref:zf-HC2 domain-containing protein n=1 Tax=Micrococcus sp. TaxID=1271 RepID=UPI002A910C2D|nr:zf-HC2 domain-containing protein [Micrococcus sp.]MDY6054579.1 zf-HC2 domain-containing protein [Micrococcus sp.]
MPTRHCQRWLDAYLEGALSGRARRHVSAHLDTCADCRGLARERARVLEAARSVDSLPVTSPRMAARGVPGRMVVAGLGTVVLCGVLLTVLWILGGPRGAGTAAALPAPGAALTLVGDGATATEADDVVRRLRAQGWAVPSLLAAGLHPVEVASSRRGESVEVSVTWRQGRTSAVVTECRGGQQLAEDCPGLAVAGGAHRLPGGVPYRVADRSDGGWAASLTTGSAAYRVEATLPRAELEALLTQVVVAERSGLLEVSGGDRPADRLERGLERIVGGDDDDAGLPSDSAVGR